jgi:predicted RNA-binding Zn-ribbon protein involved in translation (DUF1610 family)
MAFVKRVEDFKCENCGTDVIGNGFTNHCGVCLWSKHVDNDPGDRLVSCGGLMRPVGVEKGKSSFMVIHKCENCGITKRNSVALTDNFDVLASIARKFAEDAMKNQ